jgi:hypothetical protein
MNISISNITWKQRYQIEGLLKAMTLAGKNGNPQWIAFHCSDDFMPEILVDGFDKVDFSPDEPAQSRKELRKIPRLGNAVVFESDGKSAT